MLIVFNFQVTMDYEKMVEATSSLLSSFFETGSGCLTNERVRDLLNEIKTNGFDFEILDDPHVTQSNVETVKTDSPHLYTCALNILLASLI